MPKRTRVVALAGLALAVCSACGVEPLIEYAGSAMSEAIPDSSVSVTLTFWSHSDTSFSGVLRVGPPLSIGGSAYAWHEGEMLKIVTVSASGDTTLWTSQTVDEAVGGHFHVTGGPHAAEAGTWRAKLASGPALTLETLKATPGVLPPFGAFVAVVLFLGVVVGAARWVRRAPPPDFLEPAHTLFAAPVGVAGWLALFVIGQILVALVLSVRLPAAVAEVRGPIWQLGQAAALLQPLLVMETLFHVGQIVVPLAGIYLTVTRNRYAPRFWFAYLSCIVLYVLVDRVGTTLLRSQFANLTGAIRLDANAQASQAFGNHVGAVGGSVLWAAYWARSLRVRATFGSRALDKPHAVQPTVAPTAVAAESDIANAP